MSSDVNPERVLQLINSMGYKNVSANELKDFTKDLKKLIKYEQKVKSAANRNPKIQDKPKNFINITVIKEVSPTKTKEQSTKTAKTVDRPVSSQAQTETDKSENDEKKKHSKKVVRLPKHIKSTNPKIVFKKSGAKSGVIVRNTPTDLYQKYQSDWARFKSFIPGENGRSNVRNSVRRKMQQKDDDDAKVYIHFPDETGDH